MLGWKSELIKLLFVCVCAGLWLILCETANAVNMQIADIPLGGVIEVSGQRFIKVKNDAERGSQFVATTAPSYCSLNQSSGTMQEWAETDCGALATPTATNFTQGPCLTDERDGKVYEIRKFADGKCWMVDNLMYGGVTDNCAGVGTAGFIDAAYGGAKGKASYSNRFGANTYGNCYDPRVGGVAPCTAGSTACGYYYNWQAAMQDESAYLNYYYMGNTNDVQGICPVGWRVPVGGAGGEFVVLDHANGGVGAIQSSCTTPACNFWRPGNNYRGVYAGFVNSLGAVRNQGLLLSQWSTSENSTTHSLDLEVDNSNVNPGTYSNYKDRGLAVRCVKDAGLCTLSTVPYFTGSMQDFSTDDCDDVPTPSATNFTAVGCLMDERDGKTYEVRKFADGKCWMADNLAYGGEIDVCANKTSFDGCGKGIENDIWCDGGTASKTGSAWGYGDCRNNPGRAYGYLYSWQAAVQDIAAYADNNYQPAEPTQGICPDGWHLPSGGDDGEFAALDVVNGGTGLARYYYCTDPSCEFFYSSFKTVFAGYLSSSGTMFGQGDGMAGWWSSTQAYSSSGYGFAIHPEYFFPGNQHPDKSFGQSIRCIKD